MDILLDTCALYWSVAAPHLLTPKALAVISDSNNRKFVSASSAWEVVTKCRKGKAPYFAALATDVGGAIRIAGFLELPLSVRHMEYAANLPMHHTDPFDRMIAAQALVENMQVVSNDDKLDPYGVARLW